MKGSDNARMLGANESIYSVQLGKNELTLYVNSATKVRMISTRDTTILYDPSKFNADPSFYLEDLLSNHQTYLALINREQREAHLELVNVQSSENRRICICNVLPREIAGAYFAYTKLKMAA